MPLPCVQGDGVLTPVRVSLSGEHGEDLRGEFLPTERLLPWWGSRWDRPPAAPRHSLLPEKSGLVGPEGLGGQPSPLTLRTRSLKGLR